MAEKKLNLLAEFPPVTTEKWMEKMGLMADGKLTALAGDPSIFS